jgi:hypothetical protein
MKRLLIPLGSLDLSKQVAVAITREFPKPAPNSYPPPSNGFGRAIRRAELADTSAIRQIMK